MGRTYETLVLGRCIRSLRTSDSFLGPILVFTDANGMERYKVTLKKNDPDTILLVPAKDRDQRPRHSKDGRTIQYGESKMVYKRFKTLLPDYLDYYPELLYHRYILYLDVDNIVADKIQYLLDSFGSVMSLKHNSSTTSEPLSFVAQFQDPGHTDNVVWHTGLLLMDRYNSKHCLRSWRHMMDTRAHLKFDQQVWLDTLKMATRENCTSSPSCVVYPLPVKHNFGLPTEEMLDWKAKGYDKHQYPVIVHIANTRRAKRIPLNVQKTFLRKSLGLDRDIDDQNMMVDGISWDEVATVQTYEDPPRKRNGFYYLLQLAGYYDDR